MNLIRSSAAAFAVTLVLAMTSAATALQWRHYVIPEFGTEIAYPADLLSQSEKTANGIRFTGSGASLEVSALRNDAIRTPAALRERIRGTPGYEHASYNARGRNWLVISGYRGSDIFYEKFFLVGGTVQGFSLQYPASERVPFDAVVERMENGFRAGRS